jgi:hypothetical protein
LLDIFEVLRATRKLKEQTQSHKDLKVIRPGKQTRARGQCAVIECTTKPKDKRGTVCDDPKHKKAVAYWNLKFRNDDRNQ